MARPAVLSHSLYEGKINLFRIKRSKCWQTAFTIDHQLIRQTTKCEDFNEAKGKAWELYLTATIKKQQGIPIVTHTFKSVALTTIKELQDAIDNGTAKVSYSQYINTINKYLIPFFGTKHITSIDGPMLTEFAKWRIVEMKKVPSAQTVNTHNVALNYVFNTAVERKIMMRVAIPELKKDGRKAERRPDFTVVEYRKLHQYMYRKFIHRTGKGVIKERRQLLREYVLFIANTGCRPGTETRGLLWKHLRYEIQQGDKFIAISVSGKTDRRELIARHGITRPLQRLARFHKEFMGKTLDEVFTMQSNIPVFSGVDRVEVWDFGHLFEQLMNESGLMFDPRTGDNHVLYSLRHFYITQALARGEPVHAIAANTGTSIIMIQKHYNHYQNLMRAASHAGTKYPTPATIT
jgi:hypothetical protein